MEMYLCARPATFTGYLSMWPISNDSDANKAQVRDQAGCPVWQDERKNWWSWEKPRGQNLAPRSVPATPITSIILFAAREALVKSARQSGADAWISRGGVHILGLLPSIHVDKFVLDPQLSVRIGQEQNIDVPAIARFSQNMRRRVAGNLSNTDLHPYATDEWAVRIGGDGSQIRRARISQIAASELVLKVDSGYASVSPKDYALVASPRVQTAIGGANVHTRLQIAEGTLTQSGRRNVHALRSRSNTAETMLNKLGETIELGGSAIMRIDSELIRVRFDV